MEELSSLVSLAPMICTDLKAKWCELAFATDACEEGFGVACAPASMEEIRDENDAGIEADSSSEEEVDNAATGQIKDCTCVADIFAGEGGFGRAVARQLGCRIFYVDNAADEDQDLLRAGFVKEICAKILALCFFLVHMAPPLLHLESSKSPCPPAGGSLDHRHAGAHTEAATASQRRNPAGAIMCFVRLGLLGFGDRLLDRESREFHAVALAAYGRVDRPPHLSSSSTSPTASSARHG